MTQAYVGRFAPSPTGPLHAGSLVAALASWLDARAYGGRWLVRIEDVDRPRCRQDAEETILRQLAACGLLPDEAPLRQSTRDPHYEQASMRLLADGWAYPCGCSRSEIAANCRARGLVRPRGAEWIYPGTCRNGLHGKPARALRMRVEAPPATGSMAAGTSGFARASGAAHIIDWQDRRLGACRQDLVSEVGDFVLLRADGCWAYQLAVTVDDAAQGITDVVRGADLADNTPRQIHLQRLLGLPTPRYLHTPLVFGADGVKLSKQNGAEPLQVDGPLQALDALRAAGDVLGVRVGCCTADPLEWLAAATNFWRSTAGPLLASPSTSDPAFPSIRPASRTLA